MKVEQVSIGNEAQPIIIIDDALRTPETWVSHANAAVFRKLSPTYPGVRAPVPSSYLQEAMPSLLTTFRDVFGYQTAVKLVECFYSNITTAPHDLMPMQRIPHFDGIGDHKVAMLHYLCDEDVAATHFFRHRGTGFETITQDRYADYKAKVTEQLADGKHLPAVYPEKSSDTFEHIYSIPARYNRLVLYRGINLHSVGIGPAFQFDEAPPLQRLTINTFFVPTA